MITDYIRAAMHKAQYELLEGGTFFGEIPQCDGVWSNADMLEVCRDELQEVLEDWILLGIYLNHSLPVIDEIDLNLNIEVPEDVA